ncbi:MAG: DUF4129 domain-containing protein [Fuerstiella sp.]|nr:DUF4129 domain-containing protein [Fuerstiella sp.]
MRRSGYSTLRFLLLMAVGAVAHSAVAQPDRQSHRFLELPQSGMSDLQQQLQMLTQLQSLVGAPNRQPAEAQGFDSEQLNQLLQMVKQFGGDNPQDLLPMLQNISPNVIRNALNNPQARQHVEQMLRQYAKDHQLPRGRPQSNIPLLPPSEAGTLQNQSPDDPSSSPENGPGSPKSGRDIDRSDDVLRKTLEEVMKGLSDVPPTPNQSSPRNSSEALPNQPPADDDAPQNSWSDVLDRLIEEERRLRRGDGNADVFNNEPSADPSAGNQGSGRSSQERGTHSPSKSVAEYLEDLKTRPPLPVQQKARTAPQTQRSANEPGNTSSQPPTAHDESAVAREQLKRDTRSSLQRRGITETIRKIAREARQQARSSGGSPDNAANASSGTEPSEEPSSLERSLIRALDGLRKDVVEIAKDAKFKPAKPDAESQVTSRPTTDGSDTGLHSIGRTAGNFLSDLAATPESTPDSSTSAPAEIDNAVSQNAFALLALAILAGVVALFAWKSGLLATPYREPVRGVPMRAADIQTKEDVVNAFHKMALQPSWQVQHWWTHRRVAARMYRDRPEHVHAVEVLTELYEQARYLPQETAFSQDQMQSARQALKQCESC